jgi:hypothetical protein
VHNCDSEVFEIMTARDRGDEHRTSRVGDQERRALLTQRSAVPLCQAVRTLVCMGLKSPDFKEVQHFMAKPGIMVEQNAFVRTKERERFP